MDVLDFLDGTVFALFAVKTTINTGGRLGRFMKHVGEVDLEVVIGELLVHKGHVLGGVIDSKVVPAVGAEPGEIESK